MDHDATEFIDGDFQSHKSPFSARASAAPLASRAPTREETDANVAEAQRKLAELRRAQEELERERAALEETRRRQIEFQAGRQEMIQNLTRGLGLLEEAEFAARRDAEQMAQVLVGLREAVTKIQSIHEESWTKDSFSVELTRALTILENARMEWNAARLKLPALSGAAAQPNSTGTGTPMPALSPFAGASFGELCRVGLALTWPLAAVALVAGAVIVVVLLRL